jgi:hypothetical protein
VNNRQAFPVLSDLAPIVKRAKAEPFRQTYPVRSPLTRKAGASSSVRSCRWRARIDASCNYAASIARDEGWDKLTIGPVPEDSAAAVFLEGVGARPCQRYQRYQWEL